MGELVEFLSARLDEDEAPTYTLPLYTCPPGCCAPAGWVGHHCLICDTTEFGGTIEAITEVADDHDKRIHQQTRRLAEVDAKRRILEEHEASDDLPLPPHCLSEGEAHPCVTIRCLALPYADHPEFRQEWRP